MSSRDNRLTKAISLENFFHKTVEFFIAFLPWSTLISVFLVYKLHIPGGNFIKEFILLTLGIIFCCLMYQKFQKTKKFPIHFDAITIAILLYIIIMSVVTIFTTGVKWLIFGGRYDFIFLIVFLILYHGVEFLKKSPLHYIKIFLISAGAMLFFSGLLKFPLEEELLLFFGFSPAISLWDFGGAPPIFHGIEGANVRRFQWILDGPNSMGAFLILYSGLLVYYFHKKPDWYFVTGVLVLGFVFMLFYTHSRSAMIGSVAMIIVALAGGVKFLWKHYKKQLFVIGLLLLWFGWILSIKYAWTAEALIGRAGSTKWHAERMIVGMERFMEKPFGQGMGSAGPAYRHVMNLHSVDRADVEEQDRYYIPESWYIQQFVEGGFLWGILFLVISAILFFSLFFINSILAWTFAGIASMNLFLHTYESSVISFLLFGFIAIILWFYKKSQGK